MRVKRRGRRRTDDGGKGRETGSGVVGRRSRREETAAALDGNQASAASHERARQRRAERCGSAGPFLSAWATSYLALVRNLLDGALCQGCKSWRLASAPCMYVDVPQEPSGHTVVYHVCVRGGSELYTHSAPSETTTSVYKVKTWPKVVVLSPSTLPLSTRGQLDVSILVDVLSAVATVLLAPPLFTRCVLSW